MEINGACNCLVRHPRGIRASFRNLIDIPRTRREECFYNALSAPLMSIGTAVNDTDFIFYMFRDSHCASATSCGLLLLIFQHTCSFFEYFILQCAMFLWKSSLCYRFCVGDRFYLCENKILCEYDYEERLVFANMAYNPPPLSHLKRQTAIPPVNIIYFVL